MPAAIRAEREGGRGQVCTHRLRLLVSRLPVAATLFLERCASVRRDQYRPEQGDGPDSKRTIRRDGPGRGPPGKCKNNPPLETRVGRREDRDRIKDDSGRRNGRYKQGRTSGKVGDVGLKFMRRMAGGLGTRRTIFPLERLELPL